MSNRSTNATLLPVTSLALLLAIGLGACAKKSEHTSFASPDEAVSALIAAAFTVIVPPLRLYVPAPLMSAPVLKVCVPALWFTCAPLAST